MSRNRLGRETSPYLLQHKDNPVHWWPWGEEALAEAKASNRPILLSVGYAACHWCHVMAHESFEHDATAAVMNELFVNVKVDREERPDIDAIYMTALQNLGEQGGWPLTMFLTPDAEPFWGGTYFPREAKFGRAGFEHVLREVDRVYREEPHNIRHNADHLKKQLEPASMAGDLAAVSETLVYDAAGRILSVMDPVHGGIGQAPKFPQCSMLELVWRAGLRFAVAPALFAVQKSLQHMCQGGIYDHLGGGFSRYSVDQRWLAPHFEKMLYDNAQLIDLMTEVWRETRAPLFAQRITETVQWVLSEMVAEGGGFAASLDADSEGEEGKFYVWSQNEIEALLGPEDALIFAQVYDVTPGGNWEGKTILNRLNSMERLHADDDAKLAQLRQKLLKARAKRIRPGWDDKVLADWNGLMIASLARASQAFSRAEWLGAAERAYAYVRKNMIKKGRLFHAARAGKTTAAATSADYANMISAALALHEVTGQASYIKDARAWTKVLDAHYWVDDPGGYFFTADDTADVLVRTRAAHDDATPNANGTMISNLVRLWLLTGEDAYRTRAEATLAAFSGAMWQNPIAHASLIIGALDLLVPQHVVLMDKGKSNAAGFRAALNELSLPNAVIQHVRDGKQISDTSPATGMQLKGSKPTAYVCIGPQCSAPINDPAELGDHIRQLRQTAPPATAPAPE
jgi:hypothetical protein